MRTTEWRAFRRAVRVMVVLAGGSMWVLAASGGIAIVNADRHERQGTVWVVNRDLGELAIFDADSGTVLATRLVGAGAHDLCISERAGKAYIAAESIDAVTTVDLRTLRTGSIPVGPLPHHVEPSRDGRTIFVSLASHTPSVGAPQLAVIDTEDDSVRYITTSDNPLARSHGPHPSPDGDVVFVAHDIGNAVTGVDLDTGVIDPVIGPIPRAEEVVPTRFGRLLWASARGDNTVKRIDLRTGTITASIPVGTQPESVMLTPSERTLAVSLRGSPASLSFVDTVGLSLIETVRITDDDNTFGDLAVMSEDGRFVYATFDALAGGTGGVSVIDVRTRTVVDRWAYPGPGRPHGIWLSRKPLRHDARER
jgi:DNA-binding beta-propeller fold protein YncE